MSIYIELANHIDRVYESGLIPHSEESAFVKIFRVLVTEEEAAFALRIGRSFVTAESLTADSEMILDSLTQKGIVFRKIADGVKLYRLMPYFPGIVESLVAYHDNPEIARQMEIYLNELEEYKHRVEADTIFLNYAFQAKPMHISREEIRSYLDHTEWYSVGDCFCRQMNAANQRACGHTIRDMCIQTGDYARYYVDTGRARFVSRDEIEELLDRAEREGLYHEIYPVDDTKENAFICNCCTCGCMFMQLSGRIGRALVSEPHIQLNPELCTGCGQCIEECPEQAFSWDIGGTQVTFCPDHCFNCGLCVFACETHAITSKI